jgi:peptide/nickel transport system ATP-binding protein
VTVAADGALRVEGLRVDVSTDDGWSTVLDDISFEIRPGEVLGLAGESGCGKSTTAYALLGYARPGSRIGSGRVLFDGVDLLTLRPSSLRRIRGSRVALVPQNPATSLTPSIRIENQIAETLIAHRATSTRSAIGRSRELLAEVGLPDPARIGRRYPHELSGGQQQRVVIAMAVACQPPFLVLDEPTTALDVTTQAHVLALLQRLQKEHGMGMLYVSHNLGVLAQMCDRIGVMYAGRLVEVASTRELLHAPRHPYTRGLIAAVPSLEAPARGGVRLRGLLKRDELPPGCPFAPRCDFARPACFTDEQTLGDPEEDHRVACWRWPDVAVEAAGLSARAASSPGGAASDSVAVAG